MNLFFGLAKVIFVITLNGLFISPGDSTEVTEVFVPPVFFSSLSQLYSSAA
jgi:hypothetical protein